MTITTISTKEEMINDIKSKISLKIFEPETGTFIIHLIEKAETLNEAFNIYQLGTKYTKTGLHYDVKKEKATDTIHYLEKNNELSFKSDDDEMTHKLIIGDNYLALQNLLINYKGKIDVIYIDPPYGKDSMGQFASTNYFNALTRDNLLSMLHPRLMLAKKLLTKDGLIFCSIDIRNYAYVKCLFDDVFGEQNCVTTLNWKKKKQPSFLSSVAGVMEYIIVYSKNEKLIKKLSVEAISDSNKPVINSSNNVCERTIKAGIRCKCDTTFIAKGKYRNRSMEIEYLDDVNIENGRTINAFRCSTKFRTGQEEIDKFCDEDLLFITDNLSLRRDVSEEEKGQAKSICDLLLDWGQNQDATTELKAVFNIVDDIPMFDNPKPTLLIKNLIKSSMKKNPIVLDFFAGSGTTGHAVLRLNAEEEGINARFILCQLDENLDELAATLKGNSLLTVQKQIALCDEINRPHLLSEVTCERLRRIMLGKSLNSDVDLEWAKNNKPFGGNLLVFNISEVSDKEHGENKSAFDVIHEECYDIEKFKTLREKIEWVASNFENTENVLED